MDSMNPYDPPHSYEERRPRYTLDPRFLPILWVVLAVYVVPIAIAIAVEFTHGSETTDSLLSAGFIAVVTLVTACIAWLMFRWGIRRLATLSAKK